MTKFDQFPGLIIGYPIVLRYSSRYVWMTLKPKGLLLWREYNRYVEEVFHPLFLLRHLRKKTIL